METEDPTNKDESEKKDMESGSNDPSNVEESPQFLVDAKLEESPYAETERVKEELETEELAEASPVDTTVDAQVETDQIDHTESQDEDKPASKKMPGWLRKSLIFLIIGLMLILAGYLISFYTVTNPLQKSYQSVLSELSIKDSEVNNLQSQYDQTKNDLQGTQANLMKYEFEYQKLLQEYDQLLIYSEYNESFINLKYEVGMARSALLNKDSISSRQAISLAMEHFENIRNLLDEDISSGIDDQLKEIQRLVRSDTEKAIDKLRTLSENLERIPLK
jgi:cell division protein FtsL